MCKGAILSTVGELKFDSNIVGLMSMEIRHEEENLNRREKEKKRKTEEKFLKRMTAQESQSLLGKLHQGKLCF